MDSDKTSPSPLSLDPIEPAAGSGGPAGTDGARPPLPRIASADRFLAQAAEEYEKGIVDDALWRSAVAQTRNDEALVVAAYLRARATALQIQDRGRRTDSRARTEAALQPAAPEAPVAGAATARERPAHAGRRSTRLMVVIAGAVGVAIAAGAAVIGLSNGEDAVETAAVPSVRKQAVASAAPAAEAVKEAAKSAAAQAAAEREALVRKVESLEQAGNWNVQVLYAAEWTRKEPRNADAWSRLSAGYLQLEQFDEAYEAAQRAVEVAPDNAMHWASLGNLYVRLERPNDARDALERALSLDSANLHALCGALALAAGEGRRQDAAGYREQLGPQEASCERHAEAPRAETVDASAVARTAKPRGR
jgi:tetratricopeptide (TPR) repeat protein